MKKMDVFSFGKEFKVLSVVLAVYIKYISNRSPDRKCRYVQWLLQNVSQHAN